MTTRSQFALSAIVFLSFASTVAGQNGQVTKLVPKAVRAMNYDVLPSGAPFHFRTKWSNDWFIGVDDDLGTPSFWVFDRSGRSLFNTAIQVPAADKLRIDDFAAAPDGTIWAAVHAISTTRQQSFFLARIDKDEQNTVIIQTASYRPCRVTVAPDGTVWTAGYENSQDNADLLDNGRDVVRHFDSNGKLIGSTLPLERTGIVRAMTGFLGATKDRIGWYSPYTNKPGTYVEFSPDMTVLNVYPVIAAPENVDYMVDGFALTPSGKVFARASSAVGKGLPPTLFTLDRSTKRWVPVGMPPGSKYVPMLQGNDGEMLIFTGPPDRSKVQIFDIAQNTTR